METEPGDTTRSCWANGIETICNIVPKEEGYIDCGVYDVIDHEQAFRIVTKNGTSFICLITPEGEGFTGSYKWIGLNCSEMGTKPITWQFCKAISNKAILECLPNSDEADPGISSKIRMKTI